MLRGQGDARPQRVQGIVEAMHAVSLAAVRLKLLQLAIFKSGIAEKLEWSESEDLDSSDAHLLLGVLHDGGHFFLPERSTVEGGGGGGSGSDRSRGDRGCQ